MGESGSSVAVWRHDGSSDDFGRGVASEGSYCYFTPVASTHFPIDDVLTTDVLLQHSGASQLMQQGQLYHQLPHFPQASMLRCSTISAPVYSQEGSVKEEKQQKQQQEPQPRPSASLKSKPRQMAAAAAALALRPFQRRPTAAPSEQPQQQQQQHSPTEATDTGEDGWHHVNTAGVHQQHQQQQPRQQEQQRGAPPRKLKTLELTLGRLLGRWGERPAAAPATTTKVGSSSGNISSQSESCNDLVVPFLSTASAADTPLWQQEHQRGQEQLRPMQPERPHILKQPVDSGSFESFRSGISTEDVSLQHLQQHHHQLAQHQAQEPSYNGSFSSRNTLGNLSGETQASFPLAGPSVDEYYLDPQGQDSEQHKRQEDASGEGTAYPGSGAAIGPLRDSRSSSGNSSKETNLFESALRAEDADHKDGAAILVQASPTAAAAPMPDTLAQAQPRIAPIAADSPPQSQSSRKRTDGMDVFTGVPLLQQHQRQGLQGQQQQRASTMGLIRADRATSQSAGTRRQGSLIVTKPAGGSPAAANAATEETTDLNHFHHRHPQRQQSQHQQQHASPKALPAKFSSEDIAAAQGPEEANLGLAATTPKPEASIQPQKETSPPAAEGCASSKKPCKAGRNSTARRTREVLPVAVAPRRVSTNIQQNQDPPLKQKQQYQQIQLQHSDSQSTRATSWGAASAACVEVASTAVAAPATSAARKPKPATTDVDLSEPPPYSPAEVLRCFAWQLTPWERREIFEYRNIWYWGDQRQKPAGTEEAYRYGGPGLASLVSPKDTDGAYSQGSRDYTATGATAALAAAVAALPSFGSRRNSSKLGNSNRKLMNCTSGSTCSYFCDSRGEYIVSLHDHIAYRFQLLEPLGTGSFGSVFKALDHKTGAEVALKVIRNKCSFHAQGREEVKALRLLLALDSDGRGNVVHMKESFIFRGHLVLTFELLSQNLYAFLKKNRFRGFSSLAVRSIAIQLLHALRLLKRAGLVHCDVKPENVALLTDRKSTVKLIDFGSSCRDGHQQQNAYIQSRYYRSPEVLLGLPYGAEIDMWSLGCVLAELHSGSPLFPGEDEGDQLAKIAGLLGFPPTELILHSPRRDLFFAGESEDQLWLISAKHSKHSGASRSAKVPAPTSLEQALEPVDEVFLDFLKGCLCWDAADRLTPDEALQHPWLKEFHSLRHRRRR